MKMCLLRSGASMLAEGQTHVWRRKRGFAVTRARKRCASGSAALGGWGVALGWLGSACLGGGGVKDGVYRTQVVETGPCV